MHLWPSMKLRDSFKKAYLKKLEWNLHQMKIEKQTQAQTCTANASSNQQKLLDDKNSEEDNSKSGGGFLVCCRDSLFILSCCFCCGALRRWLTSFEY